MHQPRPPRSLRKPNDELGALALIIEAFADLLAARINSKLATPTDPLVGRSGCRYSKRWWDRNAGVTFEVFKDGRRTVARESAVDRAFESQAKMAPKAVSLESLDEDELALQRAGIRLIGGGK